MKSSVGWSIPSAEGWKGGPGAGSALGGQDVTHGGRERWLPVPSCRCWGFVLGTAQASRVQMGSCAPQSGMGEGAGGVLQPIRSSDAGAGAVGAQQLSAPSPCSASACTNPPNQGRDFKSYLTENRISAQFSTHY